VRGKGGAREKLDERGAGGLLRWGGVGEKQWGVRVQVRPRGGKGGGEWDPSPIHQGSLGG
jgi:hypothetical protein